MKRLVVMLLGLTVVGAAWTDAALAAKRNVVLFVVDDQGKDSIGAYGNPVIKTPNLDALAAEGRIFDYAFCTSASCSASRSVINTGQYNHATGHYGHAHSYHHFSTFDNVKSLSSYLIDADYRTCRIGKYHLAPVDVYPFETVLPCNSRSTVEMADKCATFINEDASRPFFLYFCTSDPHRGGGVVESSPHKPNRFGNRDQGYPGVTPVEYDPEEVIVPPFLPDTPGCRAELAQYYQSCSRIDQGLGRLVTHLKEAGVYDDTLIIYISDNGIAFPGAKTTLYEPGQCLPCIVRDPYSDFRGGAKCDAMVTWANLAPTILDFCGAMPSEHDMHGRSFLAALRMETCPDGWDEVYTSHTFHEITMYYPMRVVRQRRYKLLWNIAHPLRYPFASDLWASPTWQSIWKDEGEDGIFGKRRIGAFLYRPAFELYDLQSDPHEVENLAEDPAHAERLQELKDKIKGFQRRTDDPWILKWEYE